MLEWDNFRWAIPVLFLRLPDGRLFDVAKTTFAIRTVFDGLLDRYTRLFAGRNAEMAGLEAFLRQSDAGFVLVTAPAGLGETALMANLVATHRNDLAYHFFAPGEAESLREEESASAREVRTYVTANVASPSSTDLKVITHGLTIQCGFATNGYQIASASPQIRAQPGGRVAANRR